MPQVEPTQSQPSPLTEADPQSLDIYFNLPPEDLAKPEGTLALEKIISAMRLQRARWAQAEAAGKTRLPSAKKAPKAIAIGVALDDLGL